MEMSVPQTLTSQQAIMTQFCTLTIDIEPNNTIYPGKRNSLTATGPVLAYGSDTVPGEISGVGTDNGGVLNITGGETYHQMAVSEPHKCQIVFFHSQHSRLFGKQDRL